MKKESLIDNSSYDFERSSEAQSKEFFDRLAQLPISDESASRVSLIESEKAKLATQWILARKASFVLSRLRPTDALLDVGCGTGQFFRHLPTDYRGMYTGIDVSEAMIARFRERVAEETPSRLVGIDLRVLPASEISSLGTFDYVIAIGVLFYLLRDAQEAFVHDAARICRSRGFVVYDFWNRLHWRKDGNSIAPTDLSVDEAVAMAEASSLSVEDVLSSDSLDFFPAYRLRLGLEFLLQRVRVLRGVWAARRFGHRVTVLARKK
ncbi:MAG: class I SAM-dependent methyltransferase [Gammaproteobacteria bacterium]